MWVSHLTSEVELTVDWLGLFIGSLHWVFGGVVSSGELLENVQLASIDKLHFPNGKAYPVREKPQ